ncbi:MAG: hypothetical protein ACO39U_04665, partial [Bacteroidia bacterium]
MAYTNKTGRTNQRRFALEESVVVAFLGTVGLGGDLGAAWLGLALGAGVRVAFDADGGRFLGIAADFKQTTNLTNALQRS